MLDIVLDSSTYVLVRGEAAGEPASGANATKPLAGRPGLNVLSGAVVLDLDQPLCDVDSLELRFVGAVVSKLDDDGRSFRGSERLFDKKIDLLAAQGPAPLASPGATTLAARRHEFHFNIRLPTRMPPSVASEHIQVQYLLVAAVHFQNGCCGWIPMLARDSILAKREVRVRCGVVGVDSGFSSAGTTDVIDAAFMERVEACQAMLHDEAVAAARRRSSGGDKTIAAAPDDGGPDGFATLDEAADGAVPNADAIKPNIDPDSAKSADGDSQDAAAKINPAEMPILVVVRPTAGDANGSHADDEIDRMGQRAPELLWTPTCNVLAYVPTFAALDQATLRLHLRLAETHSPARVDWELMQTEEYQFRYDVSGSRMSDAKFEPGECTREYGHILADGIVTTFDEAPPASGEPCERAFMVDLDLSGGRRSDVEAVEDIRSTVATVMHYLNLKLSLVCDNEPARTETYRATCPLVMHDLAPSGEGSARAEPAGECVDQHVPLKIEPLASQAVAACSDAAAPAAEPDAAAPAMHDGLRRRRVGESLQSGAEEEASTTAPDTE